VEPWQTAVALFGIIFLGIATYEDLKYRAVTPLPLFIYAVFAIVVTALSSFDPWWLLFIGQAMIGLYLLHKLYIIDGEQAFPEGDFWVLTGALTGTMNIKGFLIFWIVLAFAELGLRLGMFLRHKSLSKALDVRTPFAPVVLVAYVGVAVTRTLLGV